MKRAQEVLDSEFRAHGTEVSWFDPSADIEGEDSLHAGQLRENWELENIAYHPATNPGHHVPHAWLEREGSAIFTQDLLNPERFVLFNRIPAHRIV